MLTPSRRSFLQALAAGFVGGPALFADTIGKGFKSKNPYLKGEFAPVFDELDSTDLKVIGRLPKDLNGMFVRNGPNPQFAPRQNYHLFEGDGMLHGVHIRDGQASYRNRWVRTTAWKEEREAGKALYPSMLDPLDLKYFAKQFQSGEPPFPNRANTALVWHHGKLLALWEGGLPYEVTAPDLGTKGEYGFGGKLRHNCTAHPKVDPHSGEIRLLGYAPLPPFLQYTVADANGKIIKTTSISMKHSSMMHDMAITKNYTLYP